MPPVFVTNAPGDPRRYLQQLESRMDGLHESVSEMGLSADASACQCGRWKSTLGQTIQEMQADVYRLCNELGQWEETSRRTTSSERLSDSSGENTAAEARP